MICRILHNKWFWLPTGLFLSILSFPSPATGQPERPNVLLLTLDDMGYGTTGAEGSTVPNITPNVDRLAAEGMLFTHGYVMTPICGPSRAAILSGRYPHCNGIMGHGEQPPQLWQQPAVVTPTLSVYLQDAGYYTAAILKNRRVAKFNEWDVAYHECPFGVGEYDRHPDAFYQRTRAAITAARQAGKPFFIYANPIDPHRPWPDTAQEAEMLGNWNPDRPYPDPPRRYQPDEVDVPAFLPDLPAIRRNLVPYYESLHRGDACIGAILQALEESGETERTLVVFLSDNGMGAIGAKATLYQDGIRTPVIIRWPGRVPEGSVDRQSLVSSIDIFPTVIEAIGLPPIDAIEGQSFLEVALGAAAKTKREYAYAASNYFSTDNPDGFRPQRAIIDKDFCYIWNSYVIRSGGTRREPKNWIDVVESSLDGSHPRLSAKIEAIVEKAPEELFDLKRDPGCWNNLAADPAYKKILQQYRDRLYLEMTATADPELVVWKAEP